MKKEQIHRIIQSWKFDTELLIPLKNKDEIIAYLKPITYKYDYNLPKLLGGWRRCNPTLSDSVFIITEQNTKDWIENHILSRKDRVLFLILTSSFKPIGHIGFSSFKFEEVSAEIDCVLRGRKDIPGVMTLALNKMIEIGKEILKLDFIYLSVGKTNEKAIKLYERCGFVKLYDIPLYRHECNNEIRWDPDDKRDQKDAERLSIKMRYKE
jgi:RimJ/RimL family protein N-acetyltransferase